MNWPSALLDCAGQRPQVKHRRDPGHRRATFHAPAFAVDSLCLGSVVRHSSREELSGGSSVPLSFYCSVQRPQVKHPRDRRSSTCTFTAPTRHLNRRWRG